MKTTNYKKASIILCFVSLAVCLLLSCQNIFQPPKHEKPAAGKGTLSLSIGGVQVGRTILPKIDTIKYRLEFTNTGTMEETIVEDLTDTTLLNPIELPVGTYDLHVIAYMVDYTKPAAEGSLNGITITTGDNISVYMTLEATIVSGTGTFSWDITYPNDVTAAKMTITHFNNDGEEEPVDSSPIDLITNKSDSIEDLDTGYYRVVIKLTRTNSGNEETAELREILHIYKNMDSHLGYEFKDNHFTSVIWVTSASDSGAGTLRWAIAQAQTRAKSTIIIDSSVKEIKLIDGLTISPTSSANITIEGNGVVITGNTFSSPASLLAIFGSIGTTSVTIRRVHFTGGKAANGGAIYNYNAATLTLESCIFSGNQAVASGGGYGGAIYTYNGNLTIKGCTFYRNGATSDGGAIYNTQQASLSLTGNLFYGNTASPYPVVTPSTVFSFGYNVVDVDFGTSAQQCGWVPATGDTFENNPFVMQTTFKPIDGTVAAKAIAFLPADYPTADFNGYSITGNAAAGAVQETETGNVCIVTFDTGKENIKISPVAVLSGDTINITPEWPGKKFVDWYTNKALTDKWVAPVTGDITLYAQWEADPVTGSNLAAKLTWLKDNAKNGGEYTIIVDHNEFITPSDGYFSFDYPATIIIKSATNILRTINFSSGNGGNMFTLEDGVTLILENITLQGQTNNINPLVVIDSGGTLIMNDGATITGNDGGGVYMYTGGTFNMNDGATISDNSASYGGGVYVNGGNFYMDGGTISGNTVDGGGGGVYVYDNGTFTMSGGTIGGNSNYANTATQGGGVYVDTNSTFIMKGDATINGNKAVDDGNNTGSGGGVYVLGTFTMSENAEISGNKATASYVYGGGVYVNSGTFEMNGGTISGNEAASTSGNAYGGGVYVTGSSSPATFNMSENALISGNTATTTSTYVAFGGGVYINEATFTMSGDAAISDNETTSQGGGVYVDTNVEFTMSENALISGNKAICSSTSNYGGGGVYVNDGIFTMDGGVIRDNQSSGTLSYITGAYGGGVYVKGGTFTMNKGATISGNKAVSSGGSGGGVYMGDGTFTMNGGTISDNTASSSGGCGGGVYIRTGTFTMNKGATISNNTANGNGNGGGVYMYAGTFDMNDGAISGNGCGCGGGVYIRTGTFTMSSDAIISDNKAYQGGGVYNSGTFTMSDNATINGNTVDINGGSGSSLSSAPSGGGVYMGANGIFNMSGDAVISGNKAVSSNGGGVYASGTLTMSDNATISENTAELGGGVNINSSTSQAILIMSGNATISNNTATYGGGVYVSTTLNPSYANGNLRMTGGTIYGTDDNNNNTNIATDTNGGAALYKEANATAEYGVTNSAGGWVKNNDLLSSGASGAIETTIEVVNGTKIRP